MVLFRLRGQLGDVCFPFEEINFANSRLNNRNFVMIRRRHHLLRSQVRVEVVTAWVTTRPRLLMLGRKLIVHGRLEGRYVVARNSIHILAFNEIRY